MDETSEDPPEYSPNVRWEFYKQKSVPISFGRITRTHKFGHTINMIYSLYTALGITPDLQNCTCRVFITSAGRFCRYKIPQDKEERCKELLDHGSALLVRNEMDNVLSVLVTLATSLLCCPLHKHAARLVASDMQRQVNTYRRRLQEASAGATGKQFRENALAHPFTTRAPLFLSIGHGEGCNEDDEMLESFGAFFYSAVSHLVSENDALSAAPPDSSTARARAIAWRELTARQRRGYRPFAPAYLSEYLPSSYDSCNDDGENSSKSYFRRLCRPRLIRRRPLDGDCTVCYQPFDDWMGFAGEKTNTTASNAQADTDKHVTWCKLGCGTNFHFNCIDEWRMSCQYRGTRLTCPNWYDSFYNFSLPTYHSLPILCFSFFLLSAVRGKLLQYKSDHQG